MSSFDFDQRVVFNQNEENIFDFLINALFYWLSISNGLFPLWKYLPNLLKLFKHFIQINLPLKVIIEHNICSNMFHSVTFFSS